MASLESKSDIPLVSVKEFVDSALAAVAFYEKQIKSVSVDIKDNLVVKIRLYVSSSRFIDLFYNSETGTAAYVLIRNNKRVFGADNTGGWHLHPKDNPDSHQRLEKSMPMTDFLKEVFK